MNQGRSRTEQARDRKTKYDELESSASKDAARRFNKKPYQSISVTEYLIKKDRIGGEQSGQNSPD